MTYQGIKNKRKCQNNKKIKDIQKEVSTQVEFDPKLEISKVIRIIKTMDSTIKKVQDSTQIKIQGSKNHTLIKKTKDTILIMETQKDMKKMLILMKEDLIKTNIQMNKMASFKLNSLNILKIISIRINKNTLKTKMMKTIMSLKELNFKKDHIINIHHM